MTFTTRMLAVFASGNGSNFEALALAARRGELGGRVAVLISDRADAPALARAERLGIPAIVLPVGRYRTRIEDETPWVECLREHAIECVLLAGFMRRIHHTLLDAFPSRILNIHPSLLPAFPGRDAIGDALAFGVTVTGCTVHVVGPGLDDGPIVAQRAVEVREDDTRERLAERIHAAEHALYAQAVRRFLEEPWTREGRRLVFHATREASHG